MDRFTVLDGAVIAASYVFTVLSRGGYKLKYSNVNWMEFGKLCDCK